MPLRKLEPKSRLLIKAPGNSQSSSQGERLEKRSRFALARKVIHYCAERERGEGCCGVLQFALGSFVWQGLTPQAASKTKDTDSAQF